MSASRSIGGIYFMAARLVFGNGFVGHSGVDHSGADHSGIHVFFCWSHASIMLNCSIPPTNHVHSRTFVNSPDHPRTFVNGTAKRALVTYSRMVMPPTDFPTLPYHSRTKLKPIPEWPCLRRTKFFRLFHSGTDFHSNDFLLEEVNLPKHKLT